MENSPKNKKPVSKKSRLFAFAETSPETISHLKALPKESPITMGQKILFFDFARTSTQEKDLRFSRSVQLFFYTGHIRVKNLIKTLVRHGILVEWFTYQSKDRIMEIRLRLGNDPSVGRLLQVSSLLLAADGLHLRAFQPPFHSRDNELYMHKLHFRVEVATLHMDRLYDSCLPQLHRCQKCLLPSPWGSTFQRNQIEACGLCLLIRESIFKNASCTNYRMNRGTT